MCLFPCQVLTVLQNAVQAAQVLQECNALLGLHSSLQPSPTQAQPQSDCLLPAISNINKCQKATPAITDSNNDCRPKLLVKRHHLELSDGRVSNESEVPHSKRAKASVHASEEQAVNHWQQADGTPACTDAIQHGDHHYSNQGNTCSDEHQPAEEDTNRVTSSQMVLTDVFACKSTEELHGKLRRLSSISTALFPDGGNKAAARCRQICAELHWRQATKQGRQQGISSVDLQELASAKGPAGEAQCQPGRFASTPRSNPDTITTAKASMTCENTQTGCRPAYLRLAATDMWQAAHSVKAVSASIDAQAAKGVGQPIQPYRSARAKVWQDTKACKGCKTATQACAHDISTSIAQPTMVASGAPQDVLPGLIRHFAATKGLSWLFCGKS